MHLKTYFRKTISGKHKKTNKWVSFELKKSFDTR